MVDLEAVDQHGVLRADHVVVGVFRKARVQAVARLARLSVADAVGQDDEVARRVEHLPCAEQLAAEGLRQERAAGAAGAVQDHHRVPHDAGRVALRRADRPVVQVQRWERFAGPEPEIADDEIAFDRGRKRRSVNRRRRGKTRHERDGRPEKNLHSGAP